MSKKSIQKLKLGMVSLSAFALLTACGTTTEQLPDTNTPPADTTEETTKTPTDTDTDTDNNQMDEQETANETTTPAETGTNTATAGILSMDFQVSLTEAVEKFHDTFGQDVHIDEVEFDDDDGQYYYKIEGWDEQNEYELKVDANTGDIREESTEADDDTHEDSLEIEKYITPEEAMQAAVQKANSDNVDEWTLEFKNGKPVYEVELEDANDVDVDAETGEVL